MRSHHESVAAAHTTGRPMLARPGSQRGRVVAVAARRHMRGHAQPAVQQVPRADTAQAVQVGVVFVSLTPLPPLCTKHCLPITPIISDPPQPAQTRSRRPTGSQKRATAISSHLLLQRPSKRPSAVALRLSFWPPRLSPSRQNGAGKTRRWRARVSVCQMEQVSTRLTRKELGMQNARDCLASEKGTRVMRCHPAR